MAEELERIYTIPLAKAFAKPRGERALRAVKLVRAFLARHMKADAGKVRLEGELNALLWSRGMKKPPRRLRVLAKRDKEGAVRALPAEQAVEKEAGKGEKAGAGKEAKEKAADKTGKGGERTSAEKKTVERPRT